MTTVISLLQAITKDISPANARIYPSLTNETTHLQTDDSRKQIGDLIS